MLKSKKRIVLQTRLTERKIDSITEFVFYNCKFQGVLNTDYIANANDL